MNFINFIISSKINFTIDFIVNLIKLINFIINLFQTKFIIKQDFITFKVNFIGDFKINYLMANQIITYFKINLNLDQK